MDEGASHGDRRDHEHQDADALSPCRAAEEQPPHDNDERTNQAAAQADEEGVAVDEGQNESEQAQQYSGDDAWPEAKRRAGRRGCGDTC